MENALMPFSVLLSITTVCAGLFFVSVVVYSFVKSKKSCEEAAKLALVDEPLDNSPNP